MGIRFTCPNGHKLHVKAFLAGKRGVCPKCGVRILIPFEEPPQQQEPLGSPAANRGDRIALGSPLADVTGSASVVIAVADAPALNSPSAELPTPPPIAATAPVNPITPVQSSTVSPTVTVGQPSIVPAETEAVSPAARYVALRERNRRKQFVFAVVLLVAVLVLGAVLVFVLQRGAGSALVQVSQPVSFDELRSSRHVLVFSDRCFNAHHALVDNS